MTLTIWLENAINNAVRSLEFALTGQSHFRINLGSATKNAQLVDQQFQANMIQEEVRARLKVLFGIEHTWPILVELRQPPPEGWRAGFYNPEGNQGRYTMKEMRGLPTHQILIIPGLARARFSALLAHELTHAFQREKNILNENQALREGMARWVEWTFLKQWSATEADKLLKIKHYTFGRSIETIVDYEKRQGRAKTIQWLCSQ